VVCQRGPFYVKSLKSVPGLILVGVGNKSKLYRVTTPKPKVPRKLVQTRVLTNCPLCGFKQRLERLTGGEYHVTDPGDLLPLEVGAIYAEKRAHGLVYEAKELRLKPGQRAEMLEALAAKVLPFIQYLQFEVPAFREALEAREFAVSVGRPVTVGEKFHAPVDRGREVERWQNVPVVLSQKSQSVPVSKSMPVSRKALVSRPVEVHLPDGISTAKDDSATGKSA